MLPFFILLLLEVIREWADSVRDDILEGRGHPVFFFFCFFLNVYSNVNIFFYFIVKPKCGLLF